MHVYSEGSAMGHSSRKVGIGLQVQFVTPFQYSCRDARESLRQAGNCKLPAAQCREAVCRVLLAGGR